MREAPDERRRPGPLAVRHHDRLPLPVRPPDDRAVVLRCRPADRLGAHRRREVPAPDPVLRRAVPHQLRARRGHRYRPGVPVRDELERLQPLRRRYLRGAPGDRGTARVLPRVDLPGPLDLRLGPPPEEGSPGHHLDHRGRDGDLRLHHPGRQLLDAAPGGLRVQRRRWPRRAEGLPGGSPQQHGRHHLLPHDRGRLPDHRRVRGRDRDVAAPSPPRPGGRSGLPRHGQNGSVDRRRVGRPRARHRRRPREGDDRAAADEDGGRRGPLHHRAAGFVLDLHDRLARREPGGLLHPHPEPPVVPRHRRRQRQGGGHQRPPGPGDGGVRPGRLPAVCAADLLELPADDRDGGARRAGRALVPVGNAARPEALDRVRPDVYRRRRIADRLRPRGGPDDGRLYAPVRRAGGGRGAPAAAADQGRAAARRGGGLRGRALPGARVLGDAVMDLQTIWFMLIAILWVGYLVLEGFDFGVGILLLVLGRNEAERRAMLRTIGPVWDGNEVWVLVAGGATFAAFPEWYATLFSGFYLALFLLLVGLIVRGVAIEYRNKREDATWRARCDVAIAFGSFVPALLWGVAFANIVAGVPIDAHKQI